MEAREQHRNGRGGSGMSSNEQSIKMSKDNIRTRTEQEVFKNKGATLNRPLLERGQGKIIKK